MITPFLNYIADTARLGRSGRVTEEVSLSMFLQSWASPRQRVACMRQAT